MGFLAPLMLIGAAAGSIPVILHLFYRARYKPLPWGAMKFLRLAVEQTSRRLKVQEYLLLVVRILVIAFIVLAFMRPVNLSFLGCAWLLAAALLFAITPTWWIVSWSTPSMNKNVLYT